MSYNPNSRGFPSHEDSSHPVAIRAGLSVQELKLMTALRMAQNSSGDHTAANSGAVHSSNSSSSYQTANPQQLRAAGIQPVVINDRNPRGRNSTRALQLAGQYSAEQFSYKEGSQINTDLSFQDNQLPTITRNLAHPVGGQLPAVSPRSHVIEGRRRPDNLFELESSVMQPVVPNAANRQPSVESTSGMFHDMNWSRRTQEDFLLDQSSRPVFPSTRCNSVAILQHLHVEDPTSNQKNDPRDIMNIGPTPTPAVRSPLQSAGRPEVLSNDEDISPRLGIAPRFSIRQESFLRPDEISSGTWLLDDWQGSKKVAMLKSRSEAFFPADQLAMFQQQQNSYSRLPQDYLETDASFVESPISSSPSRSKFPLLKSKTLPKITGIQSNVLVDSPIGSSTPKLLSRKKNSLAADMMLANEMAESVLKLDSSPFDSPVTFVAEIQQQIFYDYSSNFIEEPKHRPNNFGQDV
jgi:hypothetical protein